MAGQIPASRVRFGEFDLDFGSGELSRAGVRVPIPEQPLRVLEVLLEQPGVVVSREHLRARLWPADTFVDFEHGLNAAVKRLRDALRDSAEHPRYVQTVPKRGYRFVAPVTASRVGTFEIAPDSNAGGQFVTPAEAARANSAAARWQSHRALAILLSVVSVAVVAAWVLRPTPRSQSAAMRVVPLTAFEGSEFQPALSPDGEQVAFAWGYRDADDNVDIYVKAVGSTQVRRLTSDPAVDGYPAWSPDGLQIAFARVRGPESFVYLVSTVDGSERRVADFSVVAVQWSPDGQWLVGTRLSNYQREGVFALPVNAGVPRQLIPKEDVAHFSPVFSPDGRRLAYAACINARCRVVLLDLTSDMRPTGAPRELANHSFQITSVRWSRDGTSLIYSGFSVPWGFYLWRLRVDGTRAPERIEIAGLGAAGPTTARMRDRLAFAQVRNSISVHRLDSPLTSRAVVSSALWDYHPQFSPDGRSLAFSSSRSGESVEIWVASADGSNARQLTHGPGISQGSAAWSPDGHRIAFDSQGKNGKWTIWLIDVESGVPRQLTTSAGDENMPTWSRDGQWVYFSWDRGNGRDIWRVSSSGGQPEPVTHSGSSVIAFESRDGRELVYKPDSGESPLLARPLTGGPARQLIACVHNINFAIGAAGIYYAECGNGPERALHLFDEKSGTDRVLGMIRDPLGLAFDRCAVSPDGHTILVYRQTLTSDLMLIENFR